MGIPWTETQKKRLYELNAVDLPEQEYASEQERDQAFREMEKIFAAKTREQLSDYQKNIQKPALCVLSEALRTALLQEGFSEVMTPTIISRQMLARMTIDDQHALFSQVFWLDKNKCLRPMLAPNLYYVSRDLLRIWEKPVRIFEIGSCFRKESQGNTHLNEFTMLNLVEWGLPEEERQERIEHLADVVMKAAGLPDYALEKEESVVYGDTMDITCGGIEAASGAMGPHFLDAAWGIASTWVGIGFGLERLIMMKRGGKNVKSYSRSISYLDGARLNI